MRISTLMMYNQNMRGITDSQSLWMGYGEQMSTGKRVNRASDDPVAASQAVVLSQAQAQNDQYASARTFATQRVSIEESTLKQATDAIISAQEKVIAAGNGTLSDEDRNSYATELSGIRDQLLNLANSTDGNGRYIFAGYKTDKQPFDDTGTYSGGNLNIEQKVDASRSMVIGHTGDSVFNNVDDTDPDKEALFVALSSAIDALKTPVADDEQAKDDAAAVLDKTNRSLKFALDNVSSVRAELGTQLDELGKLDDLGDDRGLAQTQQMSNLVDVDWNETISNYVMQQTALQASYKAFTDMQGMSLFQMNR